tara:strand:+ start:9437 stop:9796 length:360 start_codon:yes stop_codon:yes gene_type:complete
MDLPQEIEVWYIIPSIRKELAKAILEEGLTQKEIAKRLCITEAAVSQYIKNKRGKEVKFTPAVLNQIKISARRIVDSKAKSASMKEIQRICKYLRRRDHICKIHKGLNQGLKGCRACKR